MIGKSIGSRHVRAEHLGRGPVNERGPVDSGWRASARARQDAVGRPIRRLLDPVVPSLADADEIVVVPDLHYPYHPSTGVVTDPAVVGSVLKHLGRETSAALTVASAGDRGFPVDRTAEFLGYPAILERTGASLLDLSSGVPSRRAGTGGKSFRVPDPLLDAAVVVVPTLRPTRAGHAAGAMRTLAAVVAGAAGSGDETPTGERAYAVTSAVAPELAIVDATVAFAGEPVATDVVFAGDPVTVDVVASDLLDRSVADDEALRLGLERVGPAERNDSETVSIQVEGAGIESAGESLSGGGLPPDDGVNGLVSTAYGLYARATGDAVPPQLEGER